MERRCSLEWVCFQNRSGYAQASQDYLYALLGSDKYNLSLLPLNTSIEQLTCSAERLKTLMSMSQHKLKPDYQVFHCIPEMQRRVRRIKKSIGFGTFETLQPPEVWIPILNENTAVICPSKFNMEVFKEAGITVPLYHIPHAIDTNLYNPSVSPQEKRDKFTFLFFGTWKKRKGWPQLFEAFFKEFDKNDNVQILMKTDKIAGSQRDIALLKDSLGLSKKETAPIIYEGRVLNEQELPKFIKSADCLISPTLGEGFGIPGMQALALEVPIIITNYSGCCDYATEETATLIEPNGFILLNELDQINQFHNKKWAHITADSVGKAMRQVMSNYTLAKNKAKIGSAFVSTNYNYSTIAEKFDRMIESLT